MFRRAAWSAVQPAVRFARTGGESDRLVRRTVRAMSRGPESAPDDVLDSARKERVRVAAIAGAQVERVRGAGPELSGAGTATEYSDRGLPDLRDRANVARRSEGGRDRPLSSSASRPSARFALRSMTKPPHRSAFGPDKTARCLLVRDGKVLLVTHSNCSPPNRGKWALPGGRLERGESPRLTLRRELREELHLEIEALHEVGRYGARERWHRVYWATCEAGPDRWDPHEIDEVRWFHPCDVLALRENSMLHLGFEADAVADWQVMVETSQRVPG